MAHLLDVNVLLALAWPTHIHHAVAQAWFAEHRSEGFSTCPITQAGFVRISSNPRFTPNSVSPAEALALLDQITALPEHQFWPDDLSLRQAMPAGSYFAGHRQITDVYLAALAASRSGKLATLDRSVAGLAVEFIG